MKCLRQLTTSACKINKILPLGPNLTRGSGYCLETFEALKSRPHFKQRLHTILSIEAINGKPTLVTAPGAQFSQILFWQPFHGAAYFDNMEGVLKSELFHYSLVK